MMITLDEYELPVAVADSVVELARMVGTKPNNISSSIIHQAKRGYRCKYVKVELIDD